jgi:glycosyltransferase involved in cell wall biosynthesis
LGHVARGIEAWAADLGSALSRRGVDVTVCKGGGRAEADYERVIPCWQRGSARARRVMRVLPRGLSWRLGLTSGYGVEQATFAWNLLRYLRAKRVDLLHVQDPHLALWVQRARRLGLVRARTILAHGTEEPVSFLKKITYLQHLAPFHEQECRAAGAWKPTWTTLPNFIDAERFGPGPRGTLRAEMGIPPDALVVLTAAAIKRTHKRIDALLEAFAGLRAADPELPAWLIVAGGRETDTDELVALGRRMLGDRVRFLVGFPRERMAELYRCADVFTLSSLKEMMPMALLEATASGLPCIVNRHPVLEWMVGPGGAAIDMAAPGALTGALRSLLRDPGRRTHLGRLARQHCLRHFGEEAVVARILDYYRSVLAPDPRTHFGPATPTERPSIRARTNSVSVVIPTFNGGPWIAQAVESVLAQSVRPAQVIVVDDGSTDDTRRRLAPHMDRIRYLVQPNQGVAAARNHGVARSSGELIAFLDADDVWHPRKLELQLKAMTDHSALALLGTAVYDWPSPTVPEPDPSACRPTPVPWRQLAVKNFITTSSVLVRREALEKAGPFDTELRGPEDYDLWLRIAETAAVANLGLPLVGYRTVPGSLGRRAATMESGLRRILRRLDDRGAWRGDWLLRRKAHGYCGYSCAYLHAMEGNQRAALSRILVSLATYPLPYRSDEVRFPLARLRMLTMILRRLPGTQHQPHAA